MNPFSVGQGRDAFLLFEYVGKVVGIDIADGEGDFRDVQVRECEKLFRILKTDIRQIFPKAFARFSPKGMAEIGSAASKQSA